MRHLLAVWVLAAVLGAVAAAHATTLPLTPCPRQTDFLCGTLHVPLDRSGRVPGTVPLHFAVQAAGPKPILVALSGGPGQSAVSDAASFATSLAPALRRYRLVVLDQRGTGESDALNCPWLQRLSELSTLAAYRGALCATQLGPRRVFYSTTDTVFDIDALRQTLKANRIALMGISYGTFVAEQYARRFPRHVARLILDSVVPPRGVDAFSRDIYGRMSRVLRAQCAGSRCVGITRDPVADVATLDRRVLAHPLSGLVPNASGHPVRVTFDDAGELINLVVAGDSNPMLQPAIPGAVAAALHGDPAELLRLRRIGSGPPAPRTELSEGLNIATFCEDSQLPYSLVATPVAARPALVAQRLAATPSAEFGPVDRETALATSLAQGCERWPEGRFDPVSTGPLPDVPALVLAGELDLRTPLENGAETAAQLPRAALVVVPGVGHDELDQDPSGCTVTALERFTLDHPVGEPCAGTDNQIAPFPPPPRGLEQVTPASGVSGTPGRIVAATIATAIDGYESLEQRAFAGFGVLAGGGLRGGRFSGSLAGDLHLVGDSYVPGVAVTGRLSAVSDLAVGALTVDGPDGLDGRLTLGADGSVTGRLGGRAIRSRIDGAVATAASGVPRTGHGPGLRVVVARMALARRGRRGALAG